MHAGDIRLYLNRCHFPVRGLGFGTRVGIWLQGCTIECPGCMVPETWKREPQHVVRLADLLAAIQPWLERCEGVTVSGGEPFEQPEGLHALVVALRQLIFGDLLVYSGKPLRILKRHFPEIVGAVDVIVSEPYVAARREAHPVLAGSSNQCIAALTQLGRSRYASWRQFPKAIGIAPARDGLDLAGIPRPGEMSRLVERLQAEGVVATLTNGQI